MLKQYDIVQIVTTKRIRYVSGPPGQSTSPHGNWSIVGFVGEDALVAKENTLARVPISDLRKIASLSADHVLNEISKAGYFKSQKINMPEYLTTIYEINIAEARRLLRDHNLKTVVDSVGERDSITQRLAKVTNVQKRNN